MNHTKQTKGLEVIHTITHEGMTAVWSNLSKWCEFYDGKPLVKNRVSGVYLEKHLFTSSNIKKLFEQELRFKKELEKFKAKI